MHHIITAPLRTRGQHPGPVEIRMRDGYVSILAGGRCIQRTGKATGTWPTPVVIDDPAVLDKLRHGREVWTIEITYADGELDVQVAEYLPQPWYRRQPGFKFDIPYPTHQERLKPRHPSDPRYLGTYSPPRPYQIALPGF